MLESINGPWCGLAKTMAAPNSRACLCYVCKHKFTQGKILCSAPHLSGS